MYVRQVSANRSPTKLQAAHAVPFTVVDKVIDVVIKLRNIREGATKTLHTNRVCITHEHNVAAHQNCDLKEAYATNENGEARGTKIILQSLGPFPFCTAKKRCQPTLRRGG